MHEITLNDIRAHCINTRTDIAIHRDGSVWVNGRAASSVDLRASIELATTGSAHAVKPGAQVLDAAGYEDLAAVLAAAFGQAANGKGKERHAQAGEPFRHQVMQDMARRFGVGALLGQAFKKSEESQRLPHDRAVAEILGAINYLAGAVIAMQRTEATRLTEPANDNTQPATDSLARS